MTFERFTERARQVVVLAQEEAHSIPHHHLGTEHILLGILREEEGLGACTLEALGIDAEMVRARVLAISPAQAAPFGPGQIPFTPRAKKVIDLSLREALSLGHNYIGTEHILLGLVRENEGSAMQILRELDADSDKIRDEVLRMLQGPGARKRIQVHRLAANVPRVPASVVFDQLAAACRSGMNVIAAKNETDRRRAAAVALKDLSRACGTAVQYLDDAADGREAA
jgi:ATP-dependent Clp protease ATP-binding subunit ClpA